MAHVDKALGIDLGGSNLRLGIVDTRGKVSELHVEPIDPEFGGDDLVDLIVARARGLTSHVDVGGIGVALSACILKDGVLEPGMTTLEGLGGYPLTERVSQELGRPCLIDNDANLALLAEAHFGAAKGFKDVLLLTLGTGIGGGLLLDGRLRRGSHGSGAEIGQGMIPDSDNGYCSLEELASPGAMMRRLGEPRGMLFERATSGDGQAQLLIDEMYELLGLSIANTHVLLDLELVLLAGGLAKSGPVLLDGVRKAFARICPAQLQFGLKIELADLAPDQGGVIGAACLWFEEKELLPPL
jgi:glucokinase